MTQQILDMELISSYLEEAQEYGLLTEVVYTALNAVKLDPKLSEAQAISIGYEEWIK